MSENKDSIFSKEYNGIKIIFSRDSSDKLSGLEVFYNDNSIFMFDYSNEYQDKVLEITKSLSAKEKGNFFDDFYANKINYINEIKNLISENDDDMVSRINLIDFVLTKIAAILLEDFNKSRTITSFENSQTISDEPILNNGETLEKTEDVLKEEEDILAKLLRSGDITHNPDKNNNIKFKVATKLPKIIERLRIMIKLGDIKVEEEYEEEYIANFIKRNIITAAGTDISNSYRAAKAREKKKNAKS